jgi:flavin reductase (DIM6/NTAB) family NADH-FMN oxidoreductase RutF
MTEEGSAGYDEAAKKRVLQLFPSPIFVVGCCKGDQVHAFGGSWLGQCSFKPPVVWVAVRAGSRPAELMEVGGFFTISVLRPDQIKTAKAFFKTPPFSDGRFGEVSCHLSAQGAPILDDCLGWVECRIFETSQPGDHLLYYGEITGCGGEGEGPVLTTVTTGFKYGG